MLAVTKLTFKPAGADGCQHSFQSGISASAWESPSRASKSHGKTLGIYGHSVGVYIYHWAVMAAFALCCMHVQVATRYPCDLTRSCGLKSHMPRHSV